MIRYSLILLILLFPSCLSPEDSFVEYPLEVEVGTESALVISTGEVLDSPKFTVADLVFYSSNPITITSGCPTKITDCMPLHICRASPSSYPYSYDSVDEVCKTLPGPEEGDSVVSVQEGMGFTVELNSDDGVAVVFVKQISGIGSATKLLLVIDLL